MIMMKNQAVLLLFLVVLALTASRLCLAFNVDVSSRVVHSGPRGACDQDCMFGFSVAQHRERGTPWLLVGAPTAESGQPGVEKAGAVFKCQPEAPGSCDLIPFDTKGNALAPTGQQYDKKSGQWFGSIVKSSGDDGIILACAPRYIYYVFMNRMDPVGTCFTARGVMSSSEPNNFRQFRPCIELGIYVNSTQGHVGPHRVVPIPNRNDYFRLESLNNPSRKLYMICDYSLLSPTAGRRDHCDIVETIAGKNFLVGKWGYHRQGSCQAGLGAAVADNGEQVFIGAPGSWYWQGQVYSLNISNPALRRRPPGGGQLFSQNLALLRDQAKTGEGSPEDDDSYLGYAVATGEFDGDGDNTDVAVGMPRGAGLMGKILIYNSNLTNLYNLTGNQIGSYFGYSLASGDLNGDGLDDLIIGAPMWTDYEAMGKYETGRVYIVYQNKYHKFKQYATLDGQQNHKARFGLSVACAGNLNLDGITRENQRGIEDIVVGAPYDGPDNRGAIYIYLGSSEGVLQKFAQVIYADNIGSSVKTFGWSLSAGMDLDENNYPDLLVGAYDSNNAVYLRSAPVVHLESQTNFKGSKQIDLDSIGRCTLRDGTRVPCADVEVKMKYDGIGVPNTLSLELQYLLDAKKQGKTKRMFFLKNEGLSARNKTIVMRKGTEWRDSFTVYVPGSGIHDKLTSLDVQVHYSLTGQSSSYATSSRFRRELNPVLGQFETMSTDSLSIQKNCGSDNLCIPNLSIESSYNGAYVIGSGDRLEIVADIINSGEDAFNAMLYLQIPRGMNYISANSSNTDVTVLCSPPSDSNDFTLKCEIGNPLPASRRATVRIFLQPSEEKQDMPLREYVFLMTTNSSNPEDGSDNRDNEKEIRIPVSIQADFRVTGTSKPEYVEYNITKDLPDKYKFEDELGEEVFHVYDVKNKGPSTIQEADVFILWPSFNENGDHLLYLLGVEYDPNLVSCEKIDNINPLYVKTFGSRGYPAAQSGSRSFSGSGYSGGASSSSSGRYETSEQGYSYKYSSSSSSSSSSRGSSSSSGTGGSYGTYGSYGRSNTYEEEGDAENEVQIGGSGKSYEGTRYGSSVEYRGGSGGHTVVAEGAEETRLFDGGETSRSSSSSTTRGGQYGSSSSRGGQYGSSSSSDGQYGSSSSSDGQYGSRRNSYDYERRYEYESGRRPSSSSSSSGSYESSYSSSREGSSSSDGDAGSSWSSGSSYSGESRSSGGGSYSQTGSSRGTVSSSGWKLLENGTYIRIYDARTTADSSEGTYSQSGGNYGSSSNYGGSTSYNRGSSYESESRTGSSSSSIGAQDSDSTRNTIFNAAVGPGDYHGTMRKTELEKEAGGPVFSATSGETRDQVENTRYQGGNAYSGSRGSSSYGTGGSSYNSRGSSSSSGSRGSASYDSNSYGSRESSSYGSSRGSSSSYGSGGSSFGSESSFGSQESSSYGSGSYGANRGSNSNRGGASYSSGSENSYESSYSASSTSDSDEAAGGKWIWSETENKWVWQEKIASGVSSSSSGLGSSDSGYGDEGSSDSGWITLPDGTRRRNQSSWSSWSSSSESSSSAHGGRPEVHQESYGSGYRGADERRRYGQGGYFESGHIGSSNAVDYEDRRGQVDRDSGSHDTGWVLLENGTYVRRQSTWSRESSYGGVQLNQEDRDNIQRQLNVNGNNNENEISDGGRGKNTTGWIRHPNGTMTRKTTAWSSWSSSSSSMQQMTPDELEAMKRRLMEEHKQKSHSYSHSGSLDVDPVPPNVEPGFEDRYQKKPANRNKRSYSDFDDEIAGCIEGRCTLMRCTIGPLKKDESALFKIRSRLVTETQKTNYADREQIMSKLVTRITRLPYQADVRQFDIQTYEVITEVFPSEMAEGEIPWWVWLLAAIGGLLLLALIIFCLFKCGFFKRNRPQDSPENEPLNNGYH